MLVLKLPLSTTEYNKVFLSRSFDQLEECHNVLVRHANKLLNILRYDKEYQELLRQYKELLKIGKDRFTTKQKELLRESSKRMSDIRRSIGITKYDLITYISVWQKHHKKYLSSHICQKEACRVWDGVEKIIFNKGSHLHYKKHGQQHTISSQSTYNGIKFDMINKTVDFMGIKIKALIPKSELKQMEYCLIESDLSNVSFFEISRESFFSGDRYYLDIYIKEDAPDRLIYGTNVSGIDPGMSTIAYVSDTKVLLTELAPDCKKYNKMINRVSASMERSRKMNNPDNYNPDGTVKKGRHTWKISKTYLKNRQKLKTIYRKKSAYTKCMHEQLANGILEDSIYINTEDMNYKGLAKRAKGTERQDRISEIHGKDNTVKHIRKYKRKKRFGTSIRDRSPSLFLSILTKKAEHAGGYVIKVDTRKLRASQYDHVTDSYKQVSLNARDKCIGNITVQRDLYSAYIIRHVSNNLKTPDRESMITNFENFVNLCNKCIDDMKSNGITYKACFGF